MVTKLIKNYTLKDNEYIISASDNPDGKIRFCVDAEDTEVKI
jgi:hypothetical protein